MQHVPQSEVSSADLQAAARALGFSIPFLAIRPSWSVIVYSVELGGGGLWRFSAEQFKAIPGPNHTSFQTEIISTDALAQFANRVDASSFCPGPQRIKQRSPNFFAVVIS